MREFVSGMMMMGFLVSGIFFLRFWSRTKDRLFALFAAAFWVLSLERLILVFIGPQHELTSAVYLVRLAAFSIILVAVLDKNRAGNRTVRVRPGPVGDSKKEGEVR